MDKPGKSSMEETLEAISKDVKHLASGEGDSLWVLGEFYTVKVSSEETGGEFALVEAEIPPRSGPPPHVHSREDECFYVLEGEIEYLAGEKTVRAGAGSVIYVPKGIVHTYKNVGETTARFLVTITPGGFEKFFEEIGHPATDKDSPPPPPDPEDVEKVMTTAPKYGLEIPPPPGA